MRKSRIISMCFYMFLNGKMLAIKTLGSGCGFCMTEIKLMPSWNRSSATLSTLLRERGGISDNSSPALSDVEGPALSDVEGFLYEFLQETVAFIFSTCIRVEKLTPHLYLFSAWPPEYWRRVSLCLKPGIPGGW